MNKKLEELNIKAKLYGPNKWLYNQIDLLCAEYGTENVCENLNRKKYKYLWKALNKK